MGAEPRRCCLKEASPEVPGLTRDTASKPTLRSPASRRSFLRYFPPLFWRQFLSASTPAFKPALAPKLHSCRIPSVFRFALRSGFHDARGKAVNVGRPLGFA